MDVPKKKVLVVEDDFTLREIVVHKLNSAGLIVVEAADGKEAIAVWEKERPDITLLDLMLPEMDGFQILETIRKHSEKDVADTPVIILSNLFNKEDIERANSLTTEDFLVKAYNTTEEILERVQDVLERQKQAPIPASPPTEEK